MQLVQISCWILLQDRFLHSIDCRTFDRTITGLGPLRPKLGPWKPSFHQCPWNLLKAFFGFGAGILIPAAYIIFGNLTDTFVDFGFYGNCQNSEVLLRVIHLVKCLIDVDDGNRRQKCRWQFLNLRIAKAYWFCSFW